MTDKFNKSCAALGIATALFISGCTGGNAEPESINAVGETSELTGEITISCYDNSSWLLDKAVLAFDEKYPNVTVIVERFAPPMEVKTSEDGKTLSTVTDDEKAATDYIQRINTELMAGKGADILQIDVIPYYKYADGGYLEDLQQYMDSDPDFNEADYRMNIMDAVKYKNKQYIFPLSIAFSFFAYDTSFFTDSQREAIQASNKFTIEQLISIADGAFTGDNYMFGLSGGYQSSSIFGSLLAENYTSFVDIANKKAYFDDGRFEQLLLSVNEYVEKGYIKDAAELEDVIWAGGEDGFARPNPDERFYYKLESHASLLQNFDKELELTNIPYYTPAYGYDKDDAIAGIAADYNGGVPCRTYYMYALNSNSKNKAIAWEFIKFLASEEMQSQHEMIGIPVNRNVFRENEETHLTYGGMLQSKLTDDNMEIFNEYIARADEFANMVDTYVIRDYRIGRMIDAEVTLYFNGEKSAKDAANALQNKVKLYLSE